MSNQEKDNTPRSSRRTQRYRNPDEADPIKRNLVKGLVVGGGILVTGGVVSLARFLTSKPEPSSHAASPEKQTSLKDRILSFTWTDASNPEHLASFIDALADEYLRLTSTPRVNKSDLTDPQYLSFYNSNSDFVRGIRLVEPNFDQSSDLWGYTHYGTNKIFLDLSGLKAQSTSVIRKSGLMSEERAAGLAILDALWHEWGHRDVTPKTTGDLINNPQVAFYSPRTNQSEVIRRFRGGAAYTDTYYGFLTFDEVWNETINIRRMRESLGLEIVIGAGNYLEDGVDFFPDLTIKMGVPLEQLYQMHATSDFEGFASLIGQRLPGTQDAVTKGGNLFVAIHQRNHDMIQKTGAFDLIK